jgi:hypothetical protein
MDAGDWLQIKIKYSVPLAQEITLHIEITVLFSSYDIHKGLIFMNAKE